MNVDTTMMLDHTNWESALTTALSKMSHSWPRATIETRLYDTGPDAGMFRALMVTEDWALLLVAKPDLSGLSMHFGKITPAQLKALRERPKLTRWNIAFGNEPFTQFVDGLYIRLLCVRSSSRRIESK